MKTISKLALLIIGISAISSITGCSKDGTIGPAGPKGIPGIANISTDSFHVIGPWVKGTLFNGNSAYLFTATDSAITPSVIAGGLVQLYLSPEYGKVGNGQNGNWVPLPYTVNGYIWNYEFSPYQITVFIDSINGTLPNTNPYSNPTYPNGATFKVVCVPPAAKAKHPTTNYKNYAEVKQTFNLAN